jgi:DNA-binding response OmpR family regulator
MFDELQKKILIVEDDLTYRNPLGSYLSAHNFSISTADDGEQAMEKLLLHKPDLVVLDLLLPKVHGFEVLKRIRSYPEESVAKTPVIILSNLSSEKDLETGQSMDIIAYFVKAHTSFDEVLKKVQEVLFKDGKGMENEVMDFRDMG